MRYFVLWIGCLLLSIAIYASEKKELTNFEERLEYSPQVLAMNAEIDARQFYLEKEMASSGWKVFGSSQIAQAQEPTSETSVRDFDSVGVQLGLSYPLLGARNIEKERVRKSETQLQIIQDQAELMKREVLKDIRQYYIQYWGAKQKLAVGQAFLSTHEQVEHILSLRKDDGLLLEPDFLEFMTAYSLVERDIAQIETDKHFALGSLNLLAKTDLNDFDPVLPVLPWIEEDIKKIQQVIYQHPSLNILKYQLDENLALLKELKQQSVESHLKLSQSFSYDQPGGDGHVTALSLNFELPFKAHDLNQAQTSYRYSTMVRIQRELEYKTQSLLLEIQKSFDDYQAKKKNFSFSVERFKAHEEALRVAYLRAGLLDGDVYEKLQQSLYAYYQAVIDMINAQIQLLISQTDLLVYIDIPESHIQYEKALHPDFWKNIVTRDGSITSMHDLMKEYFQTINPSNTIHWPLWVKRLSQGGYGAYLWNSVDYVSWDISYEKQKKIWIQLFKELDQFHIHTVFISLSAPELEHLQSDPVYFSIWLNFLDLLKTKGIRVELLLGDPHWILPENRPHLLQIIQLLKTYPFDGLHLDLEPDQLTDHVSDDLITEWILTIQAVQKISPWSVSMSLHPRYLKHMIHGKPMGDILTELQLDYIVLMIYVPDIQKVSHKLGSLLKAYPNLFMALAQSVEPESILGTNSSYAHYPQEKFYQQMTQLEKLLEDYPNFIGVFIQDWKSLRTMQVED